MRSIPVVIVLAVCYHHCRCRPTYSTMCRSLSLQVCRRLSECHRKFLIIVETASWSGAPQARTAGAERGAGGHASDGDGGSGGAKPPGISIDESADSKEVRRRDSAARPRVEDGAAERDQARAGARRSP